MLAETEKLLERLARSLLLTPDDRIRVGVATSRARTALDELHAQDRAGGNRPDRRMEG